MSVHAILAQYSGKLMHVLNSIADQQDSLLNKLVARIGDLFKKLVSAIYTQAWTILGTGLLAGAVSIGAGFHPSDLWKRLLGAAGPILGNQGSQVASLYVEADKTRIKNHLDLDKDFKLQAAQRQKEKTGEISSTLPRTIGQFQELEAQAYNYRG